MSISNNTKKGDTQHSVGYIFIYKYYYKLFNTIGKTIKNRLS